MLDSILDQATKARVAVVLSPAGYAAMVLDNPKWIDSSTADAAASSAPPDTIGAAPANKGGDAGKQSGDPDAKPGAESGADGEAAPDPATESGATAQPGRADPDDLASLHEHAFLSLEAAAGTSPRGLPRQAEQGSLRPCTGWPLRALPVRAAGSTA